MSLNVWDSLASVLFHSVDYTVDFNVFQYMDLNVWTSMYGLHRTSQLGLQTECVGACVLKGKTLAKNREMQF